MLLRTPLVWGSVGLILRDFRLVLPTKNLVSSCLWGWVCVALAVVFLVWLGFGVLCVVVVGA
jgi:hypothetical protein